MSQDNLSQDNFSQDYYSQDNLSQDNLVQENLGQENFNKELESAIENLNRIKPKARALNIKIAIENHGEVNSDELIDDSVDLVQFTLAKVLFCTIYCGLFSIFINIQIL